MDVSDIEDRLEHLETQLGESEEFGPTIEERLSRLEEQQQALEAQQRESQNLRALLLVLLCCLSSSLVVWLVLSHYGREPIYIGMGVAFLAFAIAGRRAGLPGILCRVVVLLLWPIVVGAIWFAWLLSIKGN